MHAELIPPPGGAGAGPVRRLAGNPKSSSKLQLCMQVRAGNLLGLGNVGRLTGPRQNGNSESSETRQPPTLHDCGKFHSRRSADYARSTDPSYDVCSATVAL